MEDNDTENGWGDDGDRRISEIKTQILLKKLFMGFLIKHYSKWDRVYRWLLMLIALLAPSISILNETISEEGRNEGLVIASIVLECLVAGLIKLKEFVVFDKIQDSAKAQTIKYRQLYDRIEREMMKKPGDRSPMGEFIYWIQREFDALVLNDPEVNYSDIQEFEGECRTNGFPVESDKARLQEILIISQGRGGSASLSTLNAASRSRAITMPVGPDDHGVRLSQAPERPPSAPLINDAHRETRALDRPKTEPAPPPNPPDSSLPNPLELDDSSPASPGIPEAHRNMQMPRVARQQSLVNIAPAHDRDRQNQHRTMRQKINGAQDFQWTLERLNDLERGLDGQTDND